MDGDTDEDVDEVSRGGRPIAPGDLPGQLGHRDVDLAADLQARIAELDAVAWNLPTRTSAATSRDGEDARDE